jgi:hypothetical protein
MTREDLIILAATTLYASSQHYSLIGAVAEALEIEAEVKKQRKAQCKPAGSMEEFVAQIPPRLCMCPAWYCAEHKLSGSHYIP